MVKKIYLNTNAGSVDYDEGILIIGSIIFLSIADGTQEIRFLISPNNKLYKPLKNEILLLSYPRIRIFDTNVNVVNLVQVIDVFGNAISPIKSNSIFIPVVK